VRRRIWIDQVHVPVTLSRFGLSLLLTGIACHRRATLQRASLLLRQGNVELRPKFVSTHTRLLNSGLALRALGYFAENVDKGFMISASFAADDRLGPGLACIEGTLNWTDGSEQTLRLASISIQSVTPREFKVPVGSHTIGIALATHNPKPLLFRRQIESIRKQSYNDWVCVVSDDGSVPSSLLEIRSVLGNDPRFILVAAGNQVGIYRNFERAIALVPAACQWIALSDQDDEWAPDKLEILIREAKRTQSPIVFSDLAIWSDVGQRLADTFWIYRRLEYKNLSAIAIANTVTGMAMLISSRILPIAMPFPALPGAPYHDRWLTLAGLTTGEIHYVDRALARYIQHGGNNAGVLKRSPPAVVLMLQFAGCLINLLVTPLPSSLRKMVPKWMQLIEYWNNTETLSLRLQIAALQQRLPKEQWRPEVWTRLDKISTRPAFAIFKAPLKSLLDPYRRHMVAGLALGPFAAFLIFLGLKQFRLLPRFRAVREPNS
jgi:hypothetical protein